MSKDPQILALEARALAYEVAVYNFLKANPNSMVFLQEIARQLRDQTKMALNGDVQITLKTTAGRGVVVLKMLSVAVERMNLLRFQELSQKESPHVADKPDLKLSSEE